MQREEKHSRETKTLPLSKALEIEGRMRNEEEEGISTDTLGEDGIAEINIYN